MKTDEEIAAQTNGTDWHAEHPPDAGPEFQENFVKKSHKYTY